MRRLAGRPRGAERRDLRKTADFDRFGTTGSIQRADFNAVGQGRNHSAAFGIADVVAITAQAEFPFAVRQGCGAFVHHKGADFGHDGGCVAGKVHCSFSGISSLF